MGIPEIVITLADQVASKPSGKLCAKIPVTPVVAIVIGVISVFTVSVGDGGVPTELGMRQPQVGFLFWSKIID